MHSFIVSNTPSATMRRQWGMEKSEMQMSHILFQEEDKDSYIGTMLNACRRPYPNREVRQSLNERLLDAMLPDSVHQVAQGPQLRRLLAADDFEGLEVLFRAFFSGIPHDWHRNNEIAKYEGYYASVFYSHFAAAGLDVAVEDSTSHGRLDMAVRFQGNVYLFAFKVVELAPKGAAMARLKSRCYADKYRGAARPIWLVGVEFSKETRNLVAFEVEQA